MYTFRKGDIITVSQECSGCYPDTEYTLGLSEGYDGHIVAIDEDGEECCTCQFNWILKPRKKLQLDFIMNLIK